VMQDVRGKNVKSTITKDEFEIWLINPVTDAILARAEALVEESKRQWLSLLSATGSVDQPKLLVTYLDLRARKQALESLIEIKPEDLDIVD
jgi:hypothetical protein